ncbi:MAG: glycine zipper 2TM domain-containing protein [Proteobacteria bacterium]|nr:glycine zipper 2TM domain-containing protein [Pseudomonadota bacterium]
MRKAILLLAAAATSLSIPTLADARSCQQRAHDHRVAGTVIGAIGGALVGNAISHRNGALIGGIGGAVVGNQVSRRSCDGYYYRHHRGRYRSTPSGYYYNDRRETCRLQDVSYYNDRGELLTKQVHVCR